MGLVVLLIFIALILYGIAIVANVTALVSANVLVAVDKVLGGWPTPDPLWSWALNGLVCGSLLYLACEEAPRFRNFRVRNWALSAIVGWLFVAWLVGL